MKRIAECLYQNESSKTYFALVKKDGKQIRRTLKTQDRKMAERRLRKFRDEIEELSSDSSERRLKFKPLAERWLVNTNAGLKPATARRNIGIVKRLLETFEDKVVASISRADCESWAASRSMEVKSRTFNYDLQVLKRILKYAVKSGIMLSNPSESLDPRKDPPKPIIVPARQEFEALIEMLELMTSIDARSRHAIELVKLLAFSGMRLAEATNIVWREVDFDRNTFTVSGGEIGTKNGEVRIVPLFPILRSFLEDLRKKRRESGLPAAESDTIVTIKTARSAMETACKRAELPKFNHHCMRHYFASNAIEENIPFSTIAAWFGHKDGGLLVARTYGHLRDTHSQEMAKRMA